ncbi:MAG: transcriptional regulator [Spirochaetaceae bacterium]|nr:transcriptional regulator [Spirochaetaceae bacterium]MBO7486168.1 transcriptional regulator [Spirochaetaceae bacterium]MBP5328523.1 transcriptional regulator [Spirochaetaceae bacterium]
MEYTEETKKGIDELCVALSDIQNAGLMKEFLASLLTEAEFADIGNRWLLVREIDKGTTQREIARIFKMSLCKITRGSRELKKENSVFKRVLEDFKSKHL